jgi:hypothetical protein
MKRLGAWVSIDADATDTTEWKLPGSCRYDAINFYRPSKNARAHRGVSSLQIAWKLGRQEFKGRLRDIILWRNRLAITPKTKLKAAGRASSNASRLVLEGVVETLRPFGLWRPQLQKMGFEYAPHALEVFRAEWEAARIVIGEFNARMSRGRKPRADVSRASKFPYRFSVFDLGQTSERINALIFDSQLALFYQCG